MHFGYLVAWYFFSTVFVFGQNLEKDCVDEYYANKEVIDLMLKSYRPVYDFHKHETIASIGAGSGNREIIYSMMNDSITFYMQDINPVCIEPQILSATIRRLYAIAGRSCTASFIPVRGKEKETRLPNYYFDKIIIENTLHEFEYPDDMLESIRNNLKKDGCLFIAEVIARRSGQKHKGCRKPMYTESTLIQLLNENGFRLKQTEVVTPLNNYGTLFKFERKE